MTVQILSKTNKNRTQFYRLASSWTNEMKINLIKIEERERKRSRGLIKRMTEA